jgi:aryl-alcohol dehydrogenase-like predicted oxidoreductase
MGTSTAALAMAWVIAKGDHILPIPGTRSIAHMQQLVDGCALTLGADDIARIEAALPVGWAYGDRYSDDQWYGPERFS